MEGIAGIVSVADLLYYPALVVVGVVDHSLVAAGPVVEMLDGGVVEAVELDLA